MDIDVRLLPVNIDEYGEQAVKATYTSPTHDSLPSTLKQKPVVLRSSIVVLEVVVYFLKICPFHFEILNGLGLLVDTISISSHTTHQAPPLHRPSRVLYTKIVTRECLLIMPCLMSILGPIVEM